MRVVFINEKILKRISIIVFVIYILILFVESFLRMGMDTRSERSLYYHHSFSNGETVNMIPFRSISTYLLEAHRFNPDILFYNTIGSALLFLPLGLLLPVVFRKIKHLPQIIFIALLLSSAKEALQLLLHLGLFDIDKIILHTFGYVLGFYVFRLIHSFIVRE